MKKPISKRLETTKQKNSKRWETYRRNKKKILSKKIPPEKKQIQVEKLLKQTKKKIKNNWVGYQDFKYVKTHKSPVNYLRVETKPKYYKTKDGKKSKKFIGYKLQNANGIDNLIKKQGKKIEYILVMVKIKLPETDISQMISSTFGEVDFETMTGKEMISETLEKLSLKQLYEGYQIISEHIKVIYKN